VTAIVACALDIPMLAEAAAARGLRLVPACPQGLGTAHAAVFALGTQAPGERVAAVRASGWDGPLLLLIEPSAAASVACALDAGADDAVALPAHPGEIAARLAARLRDRTPPIRLGPLQIDPVSRTATRNGRALGLLPREYALLIRLVRAEGHAVTRGELLRDVWGLCFDPGTNVVQVHVSRLRARLDRGEVAAMLHTDKGRGYRLTLPTLTA
jgi:two-component system, OmpR family, response regulator